MTGIKLKILFPKCPKYLISDMPFLLKSHVDEDSVVASLS